MEPRPIRPIVPPPREPAPAPEHVPATRFDVLNALDLKFPPLPRTVAEVSAMVAERRDVPDTPRLVRIVNDDPLVATTVLRRINSAYYGLRRRVGDIKQAVHLLGFPEVTDLVISTSMMRLKDVLKGQEQEEIFEALMRLSVGTAAYGRELAEALALPGRERAFTLGLLSNVGRLMLLYNIPNEYEALWFTNDDGLAPGAGRERTIFGVDHAQLAAIALSEWKLPDFYVEVLGNYLMPTSLDEPAQSMAFALAEAQHAASRLMLSDAPNPPYEPSPLLASLARLHEHDPGALQARIEETTEQVRGFMDTALSG